MVENKGHECSREVVVTLCQSVKHCWGLQQMRNEEWLLNLGAWKLQRVY